MKQIGLACTLWRACFAAILLFAAGQLSFAQNASETKGPAAPWSIEFELTEHLKSADGFKTRSTRLELADSAGFRIVRTFQSANETPMESSGALSKEEMDFVTASLSLLDMDQLDGKKLAIGYGKSLQPGWEGSLLLSQDNQKGRVAFSSLKLDDEAARTAQMNKLVTVVFDLKRIAEQRLQQNRGPDAPGSASPPQN